MQKVLLFLFLTSSLRVSAQDSGTIPVRQVGKSQPAEVESYGTFRIALSGGYAHRLGKIEKTGDQGLDDFSRRLRGGYGLGLDLDYFFRENWGLGLNVTYAEQQENEPGQLNVPNLGTVNNYQEINRSVYAGPSYTMRWENNAFAFYWSLGLGPVFFVSRAEMPGVRGQISKAGLGSHMGFTGEYRLNRYVGTGIKVAASGGGVKLYPDEVDKGKVSAANLLLTGFISFRTK